MAQDHPRRDDIIGEVREGNTRKAVVALGHVVFHAPIIAYHTPHASTIPDLFVVLTPCLIASYRTSRRRPPKWEFLPNPSVTKLAADRFPFELVPDDSVDCKQSQQPTN